MLFPETSYFKTVLVAKVIRRDDVGQHQPALCLAVDGSLWWAKSSQDMLWNGMLAEAVYSALAREVGAAVPDGAFGSVPGMGWSWLSRDVPLVTHWQNSAPEQFGNTDEVGAAIALDAVLFNEDRHEANVLVSVVGPYERRLWWIDADVAAVSTPAGLVAKGLAHPDPRRKHIKGLPLSQLHAGARSAAASLARMTPKLDVLASACAESARAPEHERGRLRQGLAQRMLAAPQIVENYLEALWSL